MADIKQFRTQNGTVYNFRDSRVDTLNQFSYKQCTNAADTPYGVEWKSGGTTITGTLVASKDTMYKIYLVLMETGETNNYYDEYITLEDEQGTSFSYFWEKLGSISVPDLSDYVSKAEAGALAYEDTATGTFTPHGEVSKPNITVTVGTSEVPNVTNVGSLPSFSVENETLIFSAGTLPTLGTSVGVITSASAELDNAPVFTGTSETITVGASS